MSKLLLKNSLFVLILIALGKMLSFLRDIIISAEFGSTFKTDAYFAANSIPSIIFTAIVSSYIVLLIPTYKRIEVQSGFNIANLFVSRLINMFFVLSIFLSIFGYIFIEEFIYIVAPGFDQETKELAVFLGKILILSFPFSGVALILSTISNANNKYYAPHVIPIFSSLFIIVAVFLFSEHYGIVTLAIAGVVSFVFQLMIQVLISRKHFKYNFKAKFFDSDIKKMSWLVLPIFLGFSIDQLNLLANTIISSTLLEGSLSSLNYAQRLQATITGTFSTAILTVTYPLISKLNAEKDFDRLTYILKSSLKGVFLLLTPIIVFLAFNSVSFVSIIYFRGKFDMDAVHLTSNVFLFYSINVLFISLREIILRLYYIKDQTRIPFISSIVSLFINIILSLIFVKFLGVSGLSLGDLVGSFVSLIILYSLIRNKTGININWKQIYRFSTPLVIPIGAFVIIQYFQSKFFHIGNNLFMFLASFLLAIIIYYLLLLAVKQKEAQFAFTYIKQKISHR